MEERKTSEIFLREGKYLENINHKSINGVIVESPIKDFIRIVATVSSAENIKLNQPSVSSKFLGNDEPEGTFDSVTTIRVFDIPLSDVAYIAAKEVTTEKGMQITKEMIAAAGNRNR